MRRLVLAVALVAVGTILGTSAKADVELSYDRVDELGYDQTGGHAPRERDTKERIYIGNGSIKIFNQQEEYIYRAGSDKFYIIHQNFRKYVVFGADYRNKIDSQLNDSLKDLLHAWQASRHIGHPPEQGGSGRPDPEESNPGGFKSRSLHGAPGDKIETFASWKCKLSRHNFSPRTAETKEVCLVASGEIGLSAADWKMIADYYRAQDQVFQIVTPGVTLSDIELSCAKDRCPEGFPVAILDLIDGKPASTTILAKVEHVALPMDTFDIPLGFTEQRAPELPTN